MISNVYSYYLAHYGNKSTTKYDSHRRSELKNTYSRILKINRDTPFYKIDLSEEAQKYAIDLKEHARAFSNIAASLSASEDGDFSFKKSAISNDPDSVEVEFTGDGNNPPVQSFNIEIEQLASRQVNMGNYLSSTAHYLASGKYSFDLDIGDLTYEFQFGVGNSDSIINVQEKIARLINRSSIGLEASVVGDSQGNSALRIASESTGTTHMKSTIFRIKSNQDSTVFDPVNALGFARVEQYPANAIFSIDGIRHTSKNNVLTVDGVYELSLKKETQEGSPVTISMKNDSDSIVESIEELIHGYNQMISIANSEKGSRFEGTSRLKMEFSNLARSHSTLLSENGLQVSEDGSITVNREYIEKAVSEGTISDVFRNIGKFKNAIQNKAESISLNPMDYVNNKLVAYKNPGRSLMTPYYTSAYAGMMFNGYV